ncbi:MAG: hypothetical protein IJ189_12165 [Clostridia bacterium]|nr:hypothetical protein [Clostridia bacterium]
MEKGTVTGYKALENGVVTGYKTIENGVVDGFNKITDKFVGTFLTREGESVEQAKEQPTSQQILADDYAKKGERSGSRR